jgi:hypothetical protein
MSGPDLCVRGEPRPRAQCPRHPGLSCLELAADRRGPARGIADDRRVYRTWPTRAPDPGCRSDDILSHVPTRTWEPILDWQRAVASHFSTLPTPQRPPIHGRTTNSTSALRCSVQRRMAHGPQRSVDCGTRVVLIGDGRHWNGEDLAHFSQAEADWNATTSSSSEAGLCCSIGPARDGQVLQRRREFLDRVRARPLFAEHLDLTWRLPCHP